MAAWPALAAAQVTVNQITFPSIIGRENVATIRIDYSRTSATPSVITVPLPNELGVNPPAPPAGCTVLPGPIMSCTVPPGGIGDSGVIRFDVKGIETGAFSLTATATGGSSASNNGSVRLSGDLTIGKTMSPASPLLVGQASTFTLRPQLAAGADDLPAGATLTLVDNLPGTITNFNVSAITPSAGSCNSVADANATRKVTCTLTGPLSAAQVNAASVSISGTAGAAGNLVNVASTQADGVDYVDRDITNNTAQLAYRVDPGMDLLATSNFPVTPQPVGGVQTLSIGLQNLGPDAAPAGSTVKTTIPAGFIINSLPPGCSASPIGVVLAQPVEVTCTAGALAVKGGQSFDIPLTMPAAPAAGSFPITVAPPPGYGDANIGNNNATLPYTVRAPFADLMGSKDKTPKNKAVVEGDAITTTLTVTNSQASTSAATYSGAGGGHELVVIDYLRPEEIAGDVVTDVTPGWACVVADATDPTDPARTKRVTCTKQAGGVLAPGDSLSVSFATTVGPLSGPVNLINRMCAGETALTDLGRGPNDGPQPPGQGDTANDCQTSGGNLWGTNVGAGSAIVNLTKYAWDGTTWVDPATPAVPLPATTDVAQWKITIVTPSAAPQKTIPHLRLWDTLPGVLNMTSPGAPAPNHKTAITATTNVTAGSATGACPAALTPGASQLNCDFFNVAPGTTIEVIVAEARPMSDGVQNNLARVTSVQAQLTGRLRDDAAIDVAPRSDVALTTKTITPATPRIGQFVTFTLTAENLGPQAITAAGGMVVFDDINATVGATVAYADITATAAGMSCVVDTAAAAGEPALAAGYRRVRCANSTPVAVYETRTITIRARTLKPAGMPPTGTVYTNQPNTAQALLPGMCEFKTGASTACGDAAATGDNAKTITYDVLVPLIDVQQGKTRVLPDGQTSFNIGQPLRYLFRIQNNGPSRAEGVVMTDQLTVPAGFTLVAGTPQRVNGSPAQPGYQLDTTKTATVTCSQSAANANVVCRLSAVPADDWLDAQAEVNFELVFTPTGTAIQSQTFRNAPLVCADESTAYEFEGACNRTNPGNNQATVNDTVYPLTDLSVTKRTVTPSPVAVGQPVAYDIVVQNNGPQATQQIRLQDVLPPNFEWDGTATLTLGAFVTAAPSTATAATIACTASPAALTAAGQQQTLSCVLNAMPGPLGVGAFPGDANPANTLTVRINARPKAGLFTGPYMTDRVNTVTVSSGLDANGSPLSDDHPSTNNTATSTVQVASGTIAGSVYNDQNNDGQREPTEPGYAGQTIVLTGTDDLGNAVNLTTVTDADGHFAFHNLRPGTYTLTQPAQPADSENGITTPGTGGGTATPVGTTPSVISGITLGVGGSALNNLFGEVSDSPDLVVTKAAVPTTFTEQNAGLYRLTVRNAGNQPTVGSYTVVDTLPAGMAWAGVPTASGWACQVAGQVLTCTSSTVLAPGATHPQTIDAAVQLVAGACGSQPQCTLANVVQVSGGGERPSRGPTPGELANPPVCVSPATQNVCQWPTPVQQSGGVSGQVWVDADHDRQPGAAERRVPSFAVELYLNGQLLRTATTDASGKYQFLGLVPGTGYELRFNDPATGAYYGRPVSADPAGGNDPRAIAPAGVVPGATLSGFTVPGGNGVRLNQSLPLDPGGVVYDSQTRQAVPGARVELLGSTGQPVPPTCVLGGVNALTTSTGGDPALAGAYAFWLVTPAPAGCPGPGEYQLRVTPPAGYLNAGTAGQQTSLQIPAQAGALQVPGNCVGYVQGSVCAVQSQPTPPTGSQPTPYYWRFPLDPAGTGGEMVANHIPLDPFASARIVITKQASKRLVEIGDAVTYTLTVRHLSGPPMPAVVVEDTLPRGLRYIPGTFRIAGVVQPDPLGTPGPKLTFALGSLAVNGRITYTYAVRVGAGTPQGDAINRAQAIAHNGAQEVRSNTAEARVTIGGGVFSNDACVVGKVYVDCNNNQVQDDEELGIPGVRLVLEDGTAFITDVEGKYSHCGLTPRTHVLKVDATTLPRGSRLVTSSSRNAGDANSLFLDLKNGELQRADFIEGGCRNPVLEQVKARRAQGEVRSPETEPDQPPLRWRSKPSTAPEQATEPADQNPVQPRQQRQGGVQ